MGSSTGKARRGTHGPKADFLAWLADELRAAWEVEAVLIGEKAPGSDPARLETVAFSGGRAAREWPLAGTASAAVLVRGAVAVGADAGTRFPLDPLFARQGFVAFVGARLENESGAPVGVLAALSRRPLGAARLLRVRAGLRRVAPRVAAELAAGRQEGDLPRPLVHALNNLLGIVTGNAELIAGDAPEGSLVADCAAEVLRAAQRAEALLGSPRPPETGAAEAPSPTPATGRGGGVLVVEDEPGVRRIAVAILEQAGSKPFAAGDARQAAELLKAHRNEIGLAVVDLDLPDATGIELIGRLRTIEPGLPVLVATGLPAREARRALGGTAVSGVLEKPYSIEAFVPAVLAALKEPRC